MSSGLDESKTHSHSKDYGRDDTYVVVTTGNHRYELVGIVVKKTHLTVD